LIKTGGRVQGHFADHAQAVAAAIDIAENIGNTGREAEVLVTAESRAYRKLWAYGGDLYPNSLGRPKNNRVRGTYRCREPAFCRALLGVAKQAVMEIRNKNSI
jgi:hypothetical protein